MIDKNIILDQQQPPLYKNEYIYKNEDYVWCACNTLIENGYSLANGKPFNINTLQKIIDYLGDCENGRHTIVNINENFDPNSTYYRLDNNQYIVVNIANAEAYNTYIASDQTLYRYLIPKFHANIFPGLPTEAYIWSEFNADDTFKRFLYMNSTTTIWLESANIYSYILRPDQNSDNNKLITQLLDPAYQIQWPYYTSSNNNTYNGPSTTNLPSEKQQQCFYYLNYFNYCFQEGKNSNNKYPSILDYRKRISQIQIDWKIQLTGQFNIDKNLISSIEFNLYKQNIDNIIWSKQIDINSSDFQIEDNKKLIYTFQNSQLNLEKNKLYKIILKIYYKNGNITQTNYGIIKCLDYNISSSINQINDNYIITSFDAPVSSIKVNKTYNIEESNDFNEFNICSNTINTAKYQFINLDKLNKKQIYSAMPELNYGSIIEPNIYYLNYNSNNSSLSIANEKDNSLTIGEIKYCPILTKSTNSQNCWVLNGSRLYTGYGFNAMFIPSSISSMSSKTLILPRNLFDPSKQYNNFNISIDQSYLYDNSNITARYLEPWFTIAGLREFYINDLTNVDKINQSYHNYFQAITDEDLYTFATFTFYNSLSQDQINALITKGKFYKIFSNNNTNFISNNINILNNEQIQEPNPFTENNIIKYGVGGAFTIKIDGTNKLYTLNENLLSSNKIILPITNFSSLETYKETKTSILSNCINKNKRYSNDFELTENDEYIAITIYYSDANYYNVNSDIEYYKELNRIINSIRIVPVEKKVFNTNNFMIPRQPLIYYEYKDKLNFNDNIQNITVDALFNNKEFINRTFNAPSSIVYDSLLQEEHNNEDSDFCAIINQNIDESYISIQIKANKSTMENYHFNLMRNNDIIYNFNGLQLKTINPNTAAPYLLYKDYGGKSGEKYQYYLQPIQNNIIYNKILIGEIEHEFLHLTLVDNYGIVIVKYNPKISTFKTVLTTSKIDTLGSKYPFIRINGENNYKQFQLGGLISIETLPKEELNRLTTAANENEIINNTNQTLNDVLNVNKFYKEKIYKNKVLDWLNNGQPKLLKTETEGNFIVQLMNISLNPMDQLGRMLHNFTCDAYEIADYTQENINKFNLYRADFI